MELSRDRKLEKIGRENDIVRNIASSQCRLVNPDNPIAVAESIKDMYEALKGLIDAYGATPEHQALPNWWDSALQAIKKAKGG